MGRFHHVSTYRGVKKSSYVLGAAARTIKDGLLHKQGATIPCTSREKQTRGQTREQARKQGREQGRCHVYNPPIVDLCKKRQASTFYPSLQRPY
jgi:hypothetical protein